jgi:hypothetical protein
MDIKAVPQAQPVPTTESLGGCDRVNFAGARGCGVTGPVPCRERKVAGPDGAVERTDIKAVPQAQPVPTTESLGGCDRANFVRALGRGATEPVPFREMKVVAEMLRVSTRMGNFTIQMLRRALKQSRLRTQPGAMQRFGMSKADGLDPEAMVRANPWVFRCG